MKYLKNNLVCFLAIVFTLNTIAQTEIITEDILLTNDSIQLPGMLSYNKGIKQQPLVIFIHGSGDVDRNGNQKQLNYKANYIKQLSEALNSNAIAFYRYDKRTSITSNLQIAIKNASKELVFDKFIEDAKLAITHFKDDKRFNSITLIGHSQGSLVAMLASNQYVDKYISLAGASNTIDYSIVEQIKAKNGEAMSEIVASHFKELKDTGAIKAVNPFLAGMFSGTTLDFMKSWLKYNPKQEISKLTIPVLILNGKKDLQIFESDALALHEANPKSKLVLIDNMTHSLKIITKDEDNLKTYSSPDFPLSEVLVTSITEFVKN